MIFLYRHSVEAYIAAIVCDFGHEIGTSRAVARTRNHKIVEHIPDLKSLAALVGIELSSRIEMALKQMANLDPKAQAFRFPGTQSLGERVNVGHFVSECEILLDELELVLGCLEQDEWRKVLAETLDEAGSAE